MGGFNNHGHTAANLANKPALGRFAHGLAMQALCLRVGDELQAFQLTDEVTLHLHCAFGQYFHVHLFILPKTLHEGACAAVYKSLREFLMQGIGQSIFHVPRICLPHQGIVKPICAIGNISPSANMRQTVGKRINIPKRLVSIFHLAFKPISGNRLPLNQKAIQGGNEFCVVGIGNLAVIWQLAHIPQ